MKKQDKKLLILAQKLFVDFGQYMEIIINARIVQPRL